MQWLPLRRQELGESRMKPTSWGRRPRIRRSAPASCCRSPTRGRSSRGKPSCTPGSQPTPGWRRCTRTWATSTWSSSVRRSSRIPGSCRGTRCPSCRIPGREWGSGGSWTPPAWRSAHRSMGASTTRSRTWGCCRGSTPAAIASNSILQHPITKRQCMAHGAQNWLAT